MPDEETVCTPPMGIANETACMLAPMHYGLCEPPTRTHPNAEGADVDAVERFRGELAAQFRIKAVEGDNSGSVWSGNEPAVWREAADLALTMPFEEN